VPVVSEEVCARSLGFAFMSKPAIIKIATDAYFLHFCANICLAAAMFKGRSETGPSHEPFVGTANKKSRK
jgi:hypothetical protein